MAGIPSIENVDYSKFSPEERSIVRILFEHADGEREIDRLFEMMLKERSSDLHISSDEKPMLRVDGGVRRIESLPILDCEQVTQLLAPIIPQRNRVEFIESWDTDFAYEVDGVGRFRANIFRDRLGVGAVFRLIPSEVITAEQLGLPKVLRDLCYLSKGLVLVTGPTGSGKSTTLCALIDLINRSRDDHIITIEDPIEFVHPNKRCLVNQREVGVHTNSFKAALRAALREDPDIILVGELRDLETMAIAIETAETGHLVFGTLHTSSAISTVDRLIDQFPGERQQQIRMMLSNSLKGVISQTLLKKNGGGRIAAMEILVVTAGVANLIRESKIHQIQSIMQTNRSLGMQCLNDVLFDYVNRKVVDVKEAYTKAIDKKNFLDMLEEGGISTHVLTQGAG
ncbi:MAG: type IV pilus twitching motility protein PilT [Deltaproteobacteria bacterium]|nr:MAG: type IV pilus twitching motility protein PilT [Deltaproteobacteria bacterium]